MLIRPKKPIVFLSNLQKEIKLNFITIADEEWMQEAFKAKTLEETIRGGEVKAFLSLFWRLMDDESKREIVNTKTVKFEGLEEIEIKFTDPVEKLSHIVATNDSEIMAIFVAIAECRKLSNPVPVEEKKTSQSPQPEG